MTKYLVEIFFDNFFLSLFNNIEDIWLFVVVSVGTDTETDLVWISVLFVGSCGTEDDIRRGKLKMVKDLGAGCWGSSLILELG